MTHVSIASDSFTNYGKSIAFKIIWTKQHFNSWSEGVNLEIESQKVAIISSGIPYWHHVDVNMCVLQDSSSIPLI